MPSTTFRASRALALTVALNGLAAVTISVALAQGDPAPAPAPDVSPERGAMLFTVEHCVDCHGMEGEGQFGPRLRDNPAIEDTAHVINQILRGGLQMPGFGLALDDGEIAALANFLQTMLNGFAGMITPEDVAAIRARPG